MISFLFQKSKLVTVLFFIILSLLTSCKKIPITTVSLVNEPFIIHASDLLDIRASDVITNNTTIKRKIEFINRISKLVEDSFILKIENYDTTKNFIASIREKYFNGSFKIESNNQILYNVVFENGKAIINSKNKLNEVRIKSNLVSTCKVNLIHGCVSNAINNMGVFEYMACLYSAPSCYGLLWAGCSFNYCITGEQR
jgi:hypothetical protein